MSKKWKFAIGTTSRVPGQSNQHYFMGDFDTKSLHDLCNSELVEVLNRSTCFQWQRTPHGWHLFTNYILSFDKMYYALQLTTADKVWVKIGYERGYWFLADHKQQTELWYPVQRMVLSLRPLPKKLSRSKES